MIKAEKVKIRIPGLPIYAIAVFILLMTSCRSSKILKTNKELRPISTRKLIRNIRVNDFDYKAFEIKRMSVQYDDSTSRTTFHANLKLVRDSGVLVTISKINLPVGRLLITPDSILMVNYFDKTYFRNDFRFLADHVGADIDYQMIESVLANHLFSYRRDDDESDFRNFRTYTDQGMYVLQSVKNRKLDKILQTDQTVKRSRYLKKMNESGVILEQLYIDPETYKIRRIRLYDQTSKREANIRFSSFLKVDRQLYPGNIDIFFRNPEKSVTLKLKLNKISKMKVSSLKLTVPKRYKPSN